MSYPSPLTGVVRREPAPNVVTLGCPFTIGGLVKLGARETIIKAQFTSGPGAFVISPLPFNDDSDRALGGLPVNYILAPNAVHHMAIKEWKDRYPDAKVVGCKGLARKKAIEGVFVDIVIAEFDKVLSASDLGMDDIAEKEGFKFVCFSGYRASELATYHGKSKVLVVADLILNLPAIDQYSAATSEGMLSKIMGMFSVETTFQPYISGLLMKDKAAIKKGIESLSTLDFEIIVMCHGDTIEVDAKAKFNELFKSFL
ncbi:hypothetical protein POJ06DRAFT_245496 [Lipomyces tetrasporus]|uniref:Uncharacterized protein n=1 Tax=Lipomyces tetrasporus TaxID=54092 RepID=A0AAD7QWC3_9ASCO|nr:uncharacterized protein POJ06DRAFT_245496 [Lipomyces tetrasporus]KAJ8102732.1 hypothetical protein POJ06DRAFT_245496 [Lipomyces tetrasporus]